MARTTGEKRKRSWQDVAQEAQEYRDATVDRVLPGATPLSKDLPKNVINIPSKVLSQKEVYITEMPAEDLLSKLTEGELTATGVIAAFLRRASLAQKLVYLDRCLISSSPC
jgi:amidase